MLKIWQRHFIYQFTAVFFLFLICFYSFYILIDYSSRVGSFSQHPLFFGWKGLFFYYLYVFANRAEILLPLALLLAFIKTVLSLNVKNKLLALQTAGISLKNLMYPFIFFSLGSVILLYLNEEFILPYTLVEVNYLDHQAKKKKQSIKDDFVVQAVVLENGTHLLFQSYDSLQKQFFDVYWIESIDSIYRIKKLSFLEPPQGYLVDHLSRSVTGEIFQQVSYPSLFFPDIKFNEKILQSTLFEPHVFSLTQISSHFFQTSSPLNEKGSKLLTAFYWKLFTPWLALLAILIPFPFCVNFSRQLPVFLISICCLMGFICFYLLLDAGQIVAKKQVFHPFYAVGLPFSFVFSYFGYRYLTLK